MTVLAEGEGAKKRPISARSALAQRMMQAATPPIVPDSVKNNIEGATSSLDSKIPPPTIVRAEDDVASYTAESVTSRASTPDDDANTSSWFVHPSRAAMNQSQCSPGVPSWTGQSNWKWTTTTCTNTTVLDAKATAIVMDVEESLCLCGYFEMTVLVGSVHVAGYHMRPDNIFHPIYSPRSTSLVTIVASTELANKDELINLKQSAIWLGEECSLTADQLAQASQNRTSAVVLIKTPSETVSRSVNRVCSLRPFKNLFQLDSTAESHASESLGPLFMPTAQLLTQSTPGVRAFQAPDQWKSMADELNDYDGVPRVVLCGGKDTGKSTLGRYLINGLLNKYPRVAHLECDIGQSEFTPSGLVAITLCTSPSQSFHDFLSPIYQSFHRTPCLSSSKAMECVQWLLDSYYADDSLKGVPLVVNTHGWIKGMGIHTVDTIVAMSSPTHIAQFLREGAPPALCCHPMTAEILQSVRQQNMFGLFKEGLKINSTEPILTLLDFPLPSTDTTSAKYSSADHRLMSFAAYFGASIPLVDLGSYSVSFDNISLCVLGEEVSWSQILYAFNVSLIGLISAPTVPALRPNQSDLELAKVPGYVKSLPPSHCIGLGIVRAVDTAYGLLHVISPESGANMEAVDLLVKGQMEIPMMLMQ
eukprot:Ihof_evm6s138 gene=Ihof_evmTU6s138